jgi:hypothetical protein
MTKHANDPREAMDDPKNAKEIATWYRFTMDCQLLNSATIDDLHPPSMLDCIESFLHDEHYNATDLADGFWNVSLAEKDRHKTAFATHNRLLEWVVCAQGLKNAAR